MTKWKTRLLPIAIVLVGAGVAFAMFKTPKSSLPEPASDPFANAPYVQTSQLTATSAQPEVNLYGQIISAQQVELTAPQGSKVESILVKNGQLVEQGTVLMVLSNDELQLQQAQAQSRIAEIEARISQQQLSYNNDLAALKIDQSLLAINKQSVERLSKLSQQSLSSTQELENAQRNYQNQRLQVNNRQLQIDTHQQTMRQLQANLAEQQTLLKNSNKKVADLSLRAEFTGRVNQIAVNEFETVSANQVLLVLFDDQQLQLQSFVALNLIEQIDLTQATQGKLQLNLQQFELQLSSFDQIAQSGAVALTFDFTAPKGDVIVNRFANFAWQLPLQNNVYQVPVASVYSNNRIYSVLEQRLIRQDVEVVGRIGNDLLVRSQQDLTGLALLTTRLQDAIAGLAVNLVE